MKSEAKPWGIEMSCVETDKYACKIILLKQNNETPFGFHKKRDKTICILQGTASLILESRTKTLNEKDTYHINANIMYQLKALSEDVTILEVGTPIIDDFVEVSK